MKKIFLISFVIFIAIIIYLFMNHKSEFNTNTKIFSPMGTQKDISKTNLKLHLIPKKPRSHLRKKTTDDKSDIGINGEKEVIESPSKRFNGDHYTAKAKAMKNSSGVEIKVKEIKVFNPIPEKVYKTIVFNPAEMLKKYSNAKSMSKGYILEALNNPNLEEIVNQEFLSANGDLFKFTYSRNNEGLDYSRKFHDQENWSYESSEGGIFLITQTDTIIANPSGENKFLKIEFLNEQMSQLKITDYIGDKITSSLFYEREVY